MTFSLRAGSAFLAVAASIALFACTNAVAGGGGDGGSAGGGGALGSGGAPILTCTSYTGEGCTPGQTHSGTFCLAGGASSSSGTVGQQCCSWTDVCTLAADSCATTWEGPHSCQTPLVLSFDGGPVELRADREHGFALSPIHSTITDWPTAKTPWLALDRDGDGTIGDGGELFGSMTVLADGRRASNGFAALRELDENGDGRLTAEDAGFARLVLWADADGDRRSSPGELAPLARYEILSIDLDFTVSPRCDARGNCEVERAPFTWRDASGAVRTGEIIDIHLLGRP